MHTSSVDAGLAASLQRPSGGAASAGPTPTSGMGQPREGAAQGARAGVKPDLRKLGGGLDGCLPRAGGGR